MTPIVPREVEPPSDDVGVGVVGGVDCFALHLVEMEQGGAERRYVKWMGLSCSESP